MIKSILKFLFCNRGVHVTEEVVDQESAYHVCRVCKAEREFTDLEYYALARELYR
jgi:hypothetical protein